MEQILKANILRMIDKTYKQLKVIVRNKNYDPASLRSRVQAIQLGFN